MLSAPVAAKAQTVPGVSYSASQGCPDESEFLAAVASHLRADSAGPKQRIVVELSQSETDAKAHVEFVAENGATSSRDLHAPTCGEVASAAALIVALAIDTQRAAHRTALPPATPVASVALPPSSESPPRDVVQPKPKPTHDNVFVEAGGGGRAEYDVAPTPMIGATAFVGIGDTRAWDLRAHVAYARSGVVEGGDNQQARFTLLAGGLEACVWPLVRGKRWALEPCAAVELGRVESEGLETARYSAVRQSTIWGATGPFLRVNGVFDELRLEGYGGPWIPFAGTRTFVFEGKSGDAMFHRVPAVGWLGGINLALRLD